MILDPRNTNFTREQIRELMAGTCLVRNVQPGNVVNWSCGFIGDTGEKCDFRFEEEATEYIERPDWPERLIEHIWENGHMTVTNNRARDYEWDYRDEPMDDEPLLKTWARGMVKLILLLSPLALVLVLMELFPEVMAVVLLVVAGVVLFGVVPLFLADMSGRKR